MRVTPGTEKLSDRIHLLTLHWHASEKLKDSEILGRPFAARHETPTILRQSLEMIRDEGKLIFFWENQ